ncbi:MAG: radical SAM protein, partial [Planctomycetota bacterium]
KAMGNRFFGLVGGEPFMHPQIFDILEQNRDCYFQIFTNGQFITDKVAARLREVGNATPLISVEGTEIISDERRGRRGVLSKTLKGIENAVANRLITGVCTSVCRTNIDDLVTDAWVDRLVEMGVMYTWFHVYRPMGPEPNFDLALTRDQQRRIRQFVVDARATKPIGVVDAYHDADGKALCPAATGLTHHVNPWGGVEPCPIIQFATESIHDKETRTGAEDLRPLREKVMNSPFLYDFRKLARETTRGCIVLERPDLLKKLTEKHTARDETARRTAAAELDAMTPRTSQYHPGDEIPERSWVYRLAKKFAFSDFGVYDGHDHSRTAAPFLENVDRPAAPAEPDLVELSLN